MVIDQEASKNAVIVGAGAYLAKDPQPNTVEVKDYKVALYSLHNFALFFYPY
jgi:hypothetical protein